MKTHIDTSAGEVIPGMRLRIIKMNAATEPSRAFPRGVDTQAQQLDGKTVTVSYIDDAGQIHLKESGLALIADIDSFEIVGKPFTCFREIKIEGIYDPTKSESAEEAMNEVMEKLIRDALSQRHSIDNGITITNISDLGESV